MYIHNTETKLYFRLVVNVFIHNINDQQRGVTRKPKMTKKQKETRGGTRQTVDLNISL